MNVTELARKLKITPAKLREIMPQLGFDIGVKAIKVDPQMAAAILEKMSDPKNKKRYLENNGLDKPRLTIQQENKEVNGSKEIKIPEKIAVKELAKRMDLPVANLMLELIKNGVMASLNQEIDFETASIIAEDMGFKPLKSGEQIQTGASADYSELLAVNPDRATARPPVVVVMGHVDHGKTKLLDAIRQTNIMEMESGGITQHIGAYQVEKDGRQLTFIDTPGHEAFSAMRSRGAQVADIAILLVAADDGVQPQTIEAISLIKQSELPFIVAINKIDKAEANVDKVKGELANLKLTPEDWGGETICVPVSAKQKTNIDGLLETLFLVADINKDKIVADPKTRGVGTIVESHVDKGEGPVATVLIQNGTLNKNDLVRIGKVSGKVRVMKTWKGEIINAAQPSTPVKVLGLKNVPQVGEILQVIKDRREIKRLNKFKISYKPSTPAAASNEKKDEAEEKKPQVKLILKADVLGSAEAIAEALQKIKQNKVEVRIIKQALGNITEKDIENARELSAHLIGFNVKMTIEAKRNAAEKGIAVQLFNIIYDLINFVEKQVKILVGKESVVKELGKVKILKIFRSGKKWQIAGALVTAGKVKPGTQARIVRNKERLDETNVSELEAGKEKVTEAVEGQECGIKVEGMTQLEAGDELEIFYLEELEN